MGMNWPYNDAAGLPREIPVFPLPGCLLLPRCELPLNVFEPRYIAMIDAALRGDRIIGMIQPTSVSGDETAPELFPIGCAGKLTRFAETGDGRYIISLEGVCRFEIVRETTATPYRTFEVRFANFSNDLIAAGGDEQVDREAVFRALRAYSQKNALSIDWESILKAPSETLVNALAMMSPFGAVEKQALLEARDLGARAEVLVAMTEMLLAGDGADRPPLH